MGAGLASLAWSFASCEEELSMPNKLSHYDPKGRARMVDVSDKPLSRREAEASAFVRMKRETLEALPKNPKGDPFEIARVAGIMAAKRTAELIPMCHPLPLSHIDVTMRLCENGVAISATVTTTAATGVEMEALTAASVAALTVYDMCKALDQGMVIGEIVVERKAGGKGGSYVRKHSPK
jgi:cyclic pyranopterin monophosphate synthase